MARLAMAQAGVPQAKTVMVGDRLYTDITAGFNAGIDTAFVLSLKGQLSVKADDQAVHLVLPAVCHRDTRGNSRKFQSFFTNFVDSGGKVC